MRHHDGGLVDLGPLSEGQGRVVFPGGVGVLARILADADRPPHAALDQEMGQHQAPHVAIESQVIGQDDRGFIAGANVGDQLGAVERRQAHVVSHHLSRQTWREGRCGGEGCRGAGGARRAARAPASGLGGLGEGIDPRAGGLPGLGQLLGVLGVLL